MKPPGNCSTTGLPVDLQRATFLNTHEKAPSNASRTFFLSSLRNKGSNGRNVTDTPALVKTRFLIKQANDFNSYTVLQLSHVAADSHIKKQKGTKTFLSFSSCRNADHGTPSYTRLDWDTAMSRPIKVIASTGRRAPQEEEHHLRQSDKHTNEWEGVIKYQRKHRMRNLRWEDNERLGKWQKARCGMICLSELQVDEDVSEPFRIWLLHRVRWPADQRWLNQMGFNILKRKQQRNLLRREVRGVQLQHATSPLDFTQFSTLNL